MIFSENLQQEYDKLFLEFKENERESSEKYQTEKNNYLIVRCDGIKASKNYLKDVFVNQKFDLSFEKSVNDVFVLYRKYTHPKNSPLIIGAISVFDEVSFVINIGDNYFENRIMKTATVLNGSLSSAMAINFKNQDILAFDARPIIAKNIEDIKNYYHLRWWVACKNAMVKIIRLENILPREQLYDREMSENIKKLAQIIHNHQAWSKYHQVTSNHKIYAVESLYDIKIEKIISSKDSYKSDVIDRAVRCMQALNHTT